MRHDKLEKELELLILLTENRSYTVAQLCDKLGISLRNMYYYLEFFKDAGFKMEKRGNCYSIDRSSTFFGRLTERISYTEEEAVTIRRLLNKVKRRNAIVENLKRKLDKFYDFRILAEDATSEKMSQLISKLHEAIKYERQVILRGYSSPHSKTMRDRLVEPFMLMDENREVRCYEPISRLNKTFKIARMKDVEVLDDNWEYKDGHKQMYTDAFLFSAEETTTVELTLGQLSYSILAEEYPAAAEHATKTDDSHWNLKLDVCSYIGIGRFVIGLFEDIEVKGNEKFKLYLKDKIRKLSSIIE